MPDTTNGVLQAALQYASLGWRVVPLHSVKPDGSCSCGVTCGERSRGKHPRIKAWQKEASTDEDVICAWWEKWPDANVGVALGPSSGIVDIECDSPEEEAEFQALFQGHMPVTFMYRSLRGLHWLFRHRGDLPGGAVIKLGSIGIRTGNSDKGAQSVFPPSHRGEVLYQWVEGHSPSDCELADIPKEVLARIWNLGGESPTVLNQRSGKSDEEWSALMAGVAEGGRHDAMKSICGILMAGAGDLSDPQVVRTQLALVLSVNHRNQPPMPEAEVRSVFTWACEQEQAKRAGIEGGALMPATPRKLTDAAAGGDGKKEAIRCVVVDAEPPRFELYAPHFVTDKNPDGVVVFNCTQIYSRSGFLGAISTQTGRTVTTGFWKQWNKDDGLRDRLVNTAEHRDAPLEEKRRLVVAEILWTMIQKTVFDQDGKHVNSQGIIQRLQEGGVAFSFNKVLHEQPMWVNDVERGELSQLLTYIGAESKQMGNRDDTKRKYLSKASLATLKEMIGY